MFETFRAKFSTGEYVGEQIFFGLAGQFLIFLSFFAVLLATISYVAAHYNSANNPEREKTWRKLARGAFVVHGVSVVSIFALLFFMILNHMFQYYYVWRHSSMDLATKYMISCFWEGQEGSFLLWQFWHAVLGAILIFKAKSWENTVMAVIGSVQVVLGSMVLGVFVFGTKVGINPFLLLRNAMDAPIFSRPNYMDFIADGNGLNALLQNYWMVIHPPVLFLGFASTIVPFAFAIAGLWSKRYTEWIPKALPWTLFSGGALGLGILMGGAWAYEALSFGGFWAWDPVENASLVPWLILVAGLHMMVVYKSSKQGLALLYPFVMGGFLFVLFSSFLTRSGVLGDTSVHSFTDEGLGWQLTALIAIYFALSTFLYLFRVRSLPKSKKEEELWSREFWMFVGALILVVSSMQITWSTILPLRNDLLGTNAAPPDDVEMFYNNIQIWVGIAIALLSGVVQFFSYRSGRFPKFFKWTLFSMAAALGLSLLIGSVLDISIIKKYQLGFNPSSPQFKFLSSYFLLMFFGIYAVLSNLAYIVIVARKRILLAGGSVAHIGFALLLVGVLISQNKQHVISANVEGINFGSEFSEADKRDNRLFIKGNTVEMSDYLVTYRGEKKDGKFVYYNVDYKRFNDDSTKLIEEFTLHPYLLEGKDGNLVPNPDTKHYWNKDIFTHITSFSLKPESDEEIPFVTDTIAIRDTIFTEGYALTLDSLVMNPEVDSIEFSADALFGVGGRFKAYDLDGEAFRLMPLYLVDMLDNNRVIRLDDFNPESGLTLRIEEIMPQQEKVVVSYKEEEPVTEFIIMRAIVFPYINLVWLGSILMTIGFLFSAYRRAKENRKGA